MNLELAQKVIVVTGGARGIGEAITRSLSAEGAIPCIFDRDPQAGEKLAKELQEGGGSAETFACELTHSDAVRSAVAAILTRYGRIDGIVNNAGGNDLIGLRHSVADFRASLERNVVHCFVLVQAALDALIASRGTIVNISSKCAVTGQGGTSGYVAAKGALNALTREWALDLAPHGIRVNAVAPAEVMTPLYEKLLSVHPDPEAARIAVENSIPLGRRMTTAQEIADTVVFLSSPRSSHTTGQILYVDGGYVHLDRAFTQAAKDRPPT